MDKETKFILRLKRNINAQIPIFYEKYKKTPGYLELLESIKISKTLNCHLKSLCYQFYINVCKFNEIEPLEYKDKKILRSYQETGYNDIIQNLNNTKKTLCHMPTGAGKTMLAYAVMANCISNDLQLFIIISPLIRLNNQNIKNTYLDILYNNNYNVSENKIKFKTIEVNCKNKEWITQYEKCKNNYNVILSTTYASFHLINKYLKSNKKKCDLIVADECHTISPKFNKENCYNLNDNKDYKKMNDKQKQVFRSWRSLFLNDKRYEKRLFLTATPYKHQETKVDGYYDNINLYGKVVKPITIKELITKEYLSNIIPYEVYIKSRDNYDEFNADVAHSVMKFSQDYNRKRICIYVNRKDNGNKLIESFKSNELFKKMNSDKSVKIFGYFDNCDNEEYIDFSENETLTKDEKILNAFGQNETTDNFNDTTLKIIVSVRKLTMGIDIPCIDTIVFADPKLSKSDFAQSVGRGLRPFIYESGIKKECCLLLISSSNDEFIDMIANFIEYAKHNLSYTINYRLNDSNPYNNDLGIDSDNKELNFIREILYNGSMNFDFRIMERYKYLYENNNNIKKFSELKKIFIQYNIKNIKEYEDFMSSNKIYKFKSDLKNYKGFNFQCIVDDKKKIYYPTKDKCLKVIDNINKNGIKYYVKNNNLRNKIYKFKNINEDYYYHLIDNKIPNMSLDLFYGI